MALYRGLDIGTAKPSEQQREAITHRQIDVLDISQEASVSAYQRAARADIARAHANGKTVIAVGGSGLYVRALLDEINFPPTDRAVRKRLDEQAQELGILALHERLAGLDPAAAATIEPANQRRVIRALEVIELTGKPFTANLPRHRYALPAIQFYPRVEPESLDRAIEHRARQMIREGLVEETRHLLELGLEKSPTARLAVGYPQAAAHLRGEMNEEQTIEAISLATRQLARRQRKWFARDPRLHHVNPGGQLPYMLAEIEKLAGESRTGIA